MMKQQKFGLIRLRGILQKREYLVISYPLGFAVIQAAVLRGGADHAAQKETNKIFWYINVK